MGKLLLDFEWQKRISVGSRPCFFSLHILHDTLQSLQFVVFVNFVNLSIARKSYIPFPKSPGSISTQKSALQDYIPLLVKAVPPPLHGMSRSVPQGHGLRTKQNGIP